MLPSRSIQAVMGALLALAASASAAQPGPSLAFEHLRLSEIIGRQVSDPRGEPLGRIRDLVFDSRSRKVEYVVLGGDGGELSIHPVSALSAGDSTSVVLDAPPVQSSGGASVATLSAAPARRLARASEWVGHRAKDRTGKDLGRVEDLVVSVLDGEIGFAILRTAGDGQPVHVPFDSLAGR